MKLKLPIIHRGFEIQCSNCLATLVAPTKHKLKSRFEDAGWRASVYKYKHKAQHKKIIFARCNKCKKRRI